MGLRRLLFGDPPCWCGSGKPDRFCSHREAAAIAEGQVRGGRRVSSAHAGTRRSTGALSPAAARKRRR